MTAPFPVLLVVDDEPAALDVVRRVAEQQGFRVVACATTGDGARLARDERAAAAVVNLGVPGAVGLDVLSVLAEARPQCKAILLNGHGAVDSAMEAVKRGALDCLTTPVNERRIAELLAGVREDAHQRQRLLAVESELARELSCCGMVGRSPAMRAVFDAARRFAPHLRTGLIIGEPGTGRRSLARVLHSLGTRSAGPFVSLDSTKEDPAAVETSVFGLVDSVSAASEGRPGLVDHACGGVLYIDEVTRLTADAQARLLRIIEHGEVLPVGARASHAVDVVVLAAASSDPRKHAQAGRFRSDLLWQLSGAEFTLPPLRDRREDIPYLVALLVKEAASRLGKPLVGIAADAEALLLTAHWVGNVRELRAAIEQACQLAEGPVISAGDVAASLPAGHRDAARDGESSDDGRPLSTVEREHILRALQRAGGNKKAAARMLGVSRRALYRKLERLDLGGTISRRHHDGPLQGYRGTERPPARVSLPAK